MPTNSRLKALLQRREQVAELFLSGRTMRQIAQELGIALGTVHNDMQVIEKQWMKRTNDSYNRYVSRIISKLDLIEKQAYEAFEESQGETVVATNRGRSKSGSREFIKQEVRKVSPGDPRYLEVIAKCIDHRIRVLGLNSKTKCTGTEHLPIITIETVPPDQPLDEMDE